MLQVLDLTVRYGSFTAVNDLSFSLHPGDWLMLIGPNGAGKSTVVKAVSQGLSYSGQILLDGRDLRGIPAAERARSIGILSQNNRVEYAYTVEEIVRLGRYAYEKSFLTRRDTEGAKMVEYALQAAGLSDLRHASILSLSGGEIQRTFLAQVFAQNPRILILDEPANHLDLNYQQHVFSLIEQWLKQRDRAVISVVHDLSLARRFGTHALLMRAGSVLAQGSPVEVFEPEHLQKAYDMDVYAWMKELAASWLTENSGR